MTLCNYCGRSYAQHRCEYCADPHIPPLNDGWHINNGHRPDVGSMRLDIEFNDGEILTDVPSTGWAWDVNECAEEFPKLIRRWRITRE